MYSEDTEVLQFNQYQKSGEAPFVIYADLEYLIEKIDGRKNNPENWFTAKVSERIKSDFSIFARSLFKVQKRSMIWVKVIWRSFANL